jgi:hypothetical protein
MGLLSVYLTSISEEQKEWLLESAKYVADYYNTHEFLEGLRGAL